MQTSVTVEKSVLLNGTNIIAAQQFTVPEWHVLASVLVPLQGLGVPIVCAHYRECLLLHAAKQRSCMATSMRSTQHVRVSHIVERSLAIHRKKD